MRLIDADALKEELNSWAVDLTESKFPHYIKDDADCIIDNAPTIDAVPLEQYQSMEATCVKLQKAITDTPQVVRCKDCRWWTKQEKSIQGRCALTGTYPTGGWYCANGERKDDD